MVFVYIFVSAIALYCALRYGIRDALIEIEANKEDLVYYRKSADLLEEIGAIYSSTSKENTDTAKGIYNDSFDVFTSDKNSKDKFDILSENKKKILSLEVEQSGT
ncbi:hypothetical protein IR128_07010 [Staphylococcus lentus]|uniref:hypothetical protein n=1 Tax=Mammaliicoccus lentus TaxID=42858 RepID=UPI0018841990|nr:hypothetical protein [Mammaliicoccus lentus]MBF0841448.1 hypothetical protein [Mammaliicoccus lentus]